MTTGATNWKPDFTQPNPYADMPAAYADLVSKTFVPTTDNTLSPVQQAAAKGQIPAIYAATPAQAAAQAAQAAKSSVYTADQQATAASQATSSNASKAAAASSVYANADETAPPPAPPAPPASLGTLTDSEQRVWNTVVADQDAKAATQTVINLRATNAGIAAMKSGQAKSVSISPTGDVTTVTATGNTNTGKASASSSGVDTSVPIPKVTPVAPGDNYYEWTSNGKTSDVTVNQWNSWTPQQQFTYLQSIGQIDAKSTLVINKDGTWGYTQPSNAAAISSTAPSSTVLARYTDSNGNIDIGKALAGGVTADFIIQHTSASLSDIKQAQTINKVNSVLKPNKDGTYNTSDINAAIASGKLTQADVNIVFGTIASNTTTKNTPISPANRALGDGGTTNTSYPATYSQDDWDKDIASGKIAAGSVFGSYDPKTGLVSYTTATNAAASKAVMTEINTALTSKKPNLGNVDALNTAIEDAGFWNNSALNAKRDLQTGLLYDAKTKQVLTQQDQVNRVWNTLTPEQQASVAASYSQDLYRTNPFAEITKNIAVAGEKGGLIGQMAVAPLTGITLPIAKATSGQKVTAPDIEGAVITAVGDVLMIGGGFEAISTTTNAAGKVIASSAAPAVKAITSGLLTGMGAVGVVNTIMQAKAGKTAGSTLAVEAALSVASLVGGAGGLVSSIVPKTTPNIDVAQQFINGLKDQTTPEGLAKNSPFQAPSNISGANEFGEPDVETAGHQAEVAASYKEWTQAATEYAQNQHDINDLTAKIADNRTTLDAITKSGALPDEYTAKLASDTAKMDSTLAKLKSIDDDLATKVNDTGDQFSTTLKSYNTYAKGNGLVYSDTPDEMVKNLPKDSAATIKATVNQLMNGDDSPAAIARQQEVVDNLQRQYDHFKGKTGQSADIGADLANEQSKLNLMKVGNLQQAQSDLINAREELADVKEIEDNGKLDKTTRQNLVNIQNQLESQISDREAILADAISGKGMQDIIKTENTTDADGNIIGKRMYTNDGVFKYDIDEDGNIIESSKTEESSGGGKSPNTPTETRPSPDTTTPEETARQQSSRGMSKSVLAGLTAIGVSTTTIPTVKISKNGEVVKPSTKTQTTTTKTTEVPAKQPATNPSKTPVEVPQKINNPAINPAINPQTQTPVTNPSKTPSKTTVVSPAISPSTVQQQQQSQIKGVQPIQQQQMSKAQQMSQKIVTPTQIKTDTVTKTNTIVPPPVVANFPNTKQKQTGIPKNAAGVVTWKQGVVWWTRWYPYRQQDSLPTKNKPQGAVQVTNANSAYDTIQTLTGMPPEKVPQFDMGIEEVGIKAPPHEPIVQNRASISFQRNALAKGKRPLYPNDLGAGVVETRTKQGRVRHLRLS
jgi:hypothetical protein